MIVDDSSFGQAGCRPGQRPDGAHVRRRPVRVRAAMTAAADCWHLRRRHDLRQRESCACVPDCSNKKCGDDGCGGQCPDTCRGALDCRFRSGTCAQGACVPDCAGRECGSDDCGGFCGTQGGACAEGQACGTDGRCTCQPDCAGKACGDDGCGGSCGHCASGLACSTGQCGCSPDCSGRECGYDGSAAAAGAVQAAFPAAGAAVRRSANRRVRARAAAMTAVAAPAARAVLRSPARLARASPRR